MKRFLSMTVFIAAAVVSGYGQAANQPTSQCTLKVAQAPTIRGLKLGMKMDDVLEMFPGSRENDQYIRDLLAGNDLWPNFGVLSFNISPNMYPGKERFAGVSALYFTFVDARLVQYTVQYGRPPWPRLDDFINKTAGALKLPQADSWVRDNEQRKNLMCDGFSIWAEAHDGSGSLILRAGVNPNKILDERRVAAEEEERRTFKP